MSFYDTLHKKNIIAKPGFNRWLVPPASIAIHLCIGSVYAWSMFNPALVKILGLLRHQEMTGILDKLFGFFLLQLFPWISLQLMQENGSRTLDQEWLDLLLRVVGEEALLLVLWGFIYKEIGVSLTFVTHAKFRTYSP